MQRTQKIKLLHMYLIILDPKILDWLAGKNRNQHSESINLAHRIPELHHLPSLEL